MQEKLIYFITLYLHLFYFDKKKFQIKYNYIILNINLTDLFFLKI